MEGHSLRAVENHWLDLDVAWGRCRFSAQEVQEHWKVCLIYYCAVTTVDFLTVGRLKKRIKEEDVLQPWWMTWKIAQSAI